MGVGAPSAQGAGNGQVPGFQEGGSMSQAALDAMSNEQLINLSKNGSPIDKANAAAELIERLLGNPEEPPPEKGAPEKGAPEKGGAGKGGEKGGSSILDEELRRILEKLARGETLTPEEEHLLRAALNTPAGDPNNPPDNSHPPHAGNIGDDYHTHL